MNREEEINNAGHTQYGKYAGGTPLECFKYGATWADVCPKNLWVNVKDRLPKPEQEVLLYNSASIQHYAIGWLRNKKGYNKSQWCITNGYVTDEDITHWMPIVQPNN